MKSEHDRSEGHTTGAAAGTENGLDPRVDTLSKRTFLAVLEKAPLPAAQIQRLLHAAARHTQFWTPTAKSFTRFFHTQLLAYGVVLLTGAGLCFCAANWSAISGAWRLGIVALGIAALSGLSLVLQLSSTGGKTSLALAGLLIGPLLAVYGQVYQTGADAFELFLGWALLMTPFSLLVRWPALYVVQAGLLQLALALFFSQVFGQDVFEAATVDGALCLFNLVLLAGLEWRTHKTGARRGILHKVLTVAPAIFVVAPAILSVRVRANAWTMDTEHVLLSGLLLAAYTLWFHKKPRDVFGITIVGASLIWATGHIVDQSFLHEWVGYRWEDVINGAIILGGAALLSLWLRRIYSPAADDGSEDNDPFARLKDSWRALRASDACAPDDQRPVTMSALFDRAGVSRRGAWLNDILSAKAELPIAVRVLLGFTIWVGAGLLSTVLVALDILEWPAVLKLILALAFFGAAAWVSRSRLGDLRVHLTIISVVFAEVLVGSTLERMQDEAILVLAAMQLLIIVCVRNAMTRLSATVLMNILITVYVLETVQGRASEAPLLILGSIMSLVAIALWLLRDRAYPVAALRRMYRPVSYGMTLSGIGLIGVTAMITLGGGGFRDAPRMTFPLLAAMLAVFVGAAAYRAYRPKQGPTPHDRVATLAIGGYALLLSAVAYVSAPLALALIFLPIGHMRRERVLSVLATVSALLGAVQWYVASHSTLVEKSVILLVVGGCFLLARFLLARLTGIDENEQRAPEVHAQGLSAQRSAAVPALFAPARAYRGWFAGPRPVVGVVLATSLALGVPTGLALHKAHIIESGTSILVRLAPQDPRSIMQGDYMTLRYQHGGAVLRDADADARFNRQASDGFVYARTAPATSAVGPNAGQPFDVVESLYAHPQEDAVKVRYRLRNAQLRIAPTSFFFPEGQASLFRRARYAELVVSPEGTAVLKSLYTEDFATIEQVRDALPRKVK